MKDDEHAKRKNKIGYKFEAFVFVDAEPTHAKRPPVLRRRLCAALPCYHVN